eukprot:TRINITY_DN4466_c0_g1_i1.p1 TRINITY_DN4466_c0_g1~~TRINITY_DN4466_c0_g1_i1.p1  ORF type:complete len:104 (+),score=14.46 TRINITY_DN4466_c0_g1_i1:2-313(+)
MNRACGALCIICLNTDNRVQAARLGGIECILDVMRKHTDNAGVMEQACAALRIICLNADNQVQAAQLGGSECVLDVMRRHPTLEIARRLHDNVFASNSTCSVQ